MLSPKTRPIHWLSGIGLTLQVALGLWGLTRIVGVWLSTIHVRSSSTGLSSALLVFASAVMAATTIAPIGIWRKRASDAAKNGVP